MKKSLLVSVILLIFCDSYIFSQGSAERRQQYLKQSLQLNIAQRFRDNTRRISVQDSTWTDWLSRSGELPPDFAAMRSYPFLPDPLVLYKNGQDYPITTREQWAEQRDSIKRRFEHWISGQAPPAPKDFKVEIVSDKTERKTRLQTIKLRFGPGYKGMMTLELMIPEGEGPLPVFMTQWTHREWAMLAVRRGYIGCVYAAADLKDDTDPYQFIYPDDDFTLLMRRAWGASRVVDYLFTRPEVNKKQIALTGHSRNGKQSLWAAAFDDRIGAVISNSSSTGGDAPWRYGDPQYASETIDYVTAIQGHWFHPRLRFFFGREDKLPVDQNQLAALIAPRPLLYHYSIVERGLNSWANEQNYYSVKKVYDWMGVPENIAVLTRMGEHAVAARDIERTIDFLDIHFKPQTSLSWTNHLYYPYQYDEWKKTHGGELAQAAAVVPVKLQVKYKSLQAFEQDKKKSIENLQWLLGDEPSGVRAIGVGSFDSPKTDWITDIIPRPTVRGAKMIHLSPYSSIGELLFGVMYCPVDENGNIQKPAGGRLPVVLYSHQYAYSTGFSKGDDRDGPTGTRDLFESLIKQGFAVMAIDMFGFGTRIDEATNFYQRHPGWSKMGKMIRDLRSCIDAVEDIDYLDAQHIFLLGNTIGGAVSLMTAALDERVAGVATVAAFSPWRSSNSQYESLRTYSHLHGFIPKLGFYADNPENVPVDFAEIIAAAAPKPLLLIEPDLDRYTNIIDLKKIMEPVKRVYELYEKTDQLVMMYPPEINRLTKGMYGVIGDFFKNSVRHDASKNSDAENSGAWEILFDGQHTDKWKNLKNDTLPLHGWAVEEGSLFLKDPQKGEDIITRAVYADFHLKFEFQLTPGANSGIKYFVDTIKNNHTGKMVWNGPEYQIIDDYNHPEVKENKHPLGSAAALYLVYAPENKKLLPAGKWNEGEIVARGNHVEHWLNGIKVVSYERGTGDFRARIARTKFNDYTHYGELKRGHIMLTAHGDKVFFRNIKVKRL